jgi:hypothetical protein
MGHGAVKKRSTTEHPVDLSVRLIALTQGLFSLVDTSEYNRINAAFWCAHYSPKNKTFYATRTDIVGGQRIPLRLHNLILHPPPGMFVDHKNRNGLDNRIANLRLSTRSENTFNRNTQSNNTSGYPGVVWMKESEKWHVVIAKGGTRYHLGNYKDFDKAVAVRKAKEIELYGSFVPIEHSSSSLGCISEQP